MKIGIIGATGKAGQFLVNEALDKGYNVTAIVRNKSKLQNDQVAVLEKDLFALTDSDIKNFDVVIDAYKAPAGQEELHVAAMKHLIEIFSKQPQVRLLVVGGAGSLYVNKENTLRVLDTPNFPDAYKQTATNMALSFELLKQSKVNWTYFSPAAFFDPTGRRTGHYTLGDEHLLTNKMGESYVSYNDYAIAMIDEIKNGSFIRKRFTIVSNK